MKFKNDEDVILMGRDSVDLPHSGTVMKKGGWVWPLVVLLLCFLLNTATYVYAWIMDCKVWEFPNSVNALWYGTISFLLLITLLNLRTPPFAGR